ncbi:MAG: hypothetical protein PF693_14400 [Spirochaetia bacterium]|nr:hypothetical protein [Spirochaetia bacterium]
MKFADILNTEHQDELIERAGIMEFSGNIPRKFAEENAAKLLSRKYDLYEQGDWFGKSYEKIEEGW